jgi:hypothetical protein
MPDTVAEARRLIQNRLRAIEKERGRLEAALRELGVAAPARRSRPNVGSRTRARRAIAPAGQRREQLVAYLKRNPGARARDVTAALGISPANAQNVLRRALSEKRIKRQGKGYAVSGKP